MTEEEWLTCVDPQRMLSFIWTQTTKRKIRSFNSACCRRIWHLMTDWRCRAAVEAAERFDAGKGTVESLNVAIALVHDALINGPHNLEFLNPAVAAYSTVYDELPLIQRYGPRVVAWYAAQVIAREADNGGLEGAAAFFQAKANEMAAQTVLLRDIVGNPFHPMAFDPQMRTADVVSLARVIYEERVFDRLPSLADALMDAGCNDEAILAHCQSEGPHVRGCWVVDLVLGKA